MKRYFLDTNVILRFLRDDDPKQSPQAAKLFASADNRECVLTVTRDVIAECEWVLRSSYKVERVQLAHQLSELLKRPGIVTPEETILANGIKRYADSNLDIIDCLLAAVTVANQAELATFDVGIAKKFPDVKIWDRSGGN